jgi:hypothetical protein
VGKVEDKVKMSLCTQRRHTGSRGIAPLILTSGKKLDDRSASQPHHFTLGRRYVDVRLKARYTPEPFWALWATRTLFLLSGIERQFLGRSKRIPLRYRLLYRDPSRRIEERETHGEIWDFIWWGGGGRERASLFRRLPAFTYWSRV